MTLRRPSFPSFLFLYFHVLGAFHTTSDAALSSHPLQSINCSTSGNYTSTSAYAANLNQFLAALPEKTVSKNGGFFNGTVGEGEGTVYGLAMCSADYSRSDCGDCLAATASSDTNGLPNLCPGSTNVVALFDPCLVRYSDSNFFGRAEIGAGPIYTLPGASVSGDEAYSEAVVKSFKEATAKAVTLAQRFSASSSDPYTLVQCTWDLPPEQCKRCLDVLSDNATESNWFRMTIDSKRKSYSCTARYSNTSFVVVPFGGAPTPQPVDQATTPTSQSSGAAATKGSVNIGAVVGSVVGVLLLACLAGLIWYVLYGQQPNTSGHVRKFTYQQLKTATRDFAEIQVLGQGGFGTVYKGIVRTLPDREGNQRELFVAIKKNTHARSDEAMKAFNNEIDVMSPLNHCNIIRLLGWCKDKKNLFLVYELADDLNLKDRLHGTQGSNFVLDWHQRYNILVGIASGLDYLHNNCARTVLHMDIKPDNVMLDKNFNAKLCDFGLVTQLTKAITSESKKIIIGTQAYMDPLCLQNKKINKESDVYSFGVLLLEVVCGKKPILIDTDGKNSLIEKVRNCERENAIFDAADTRLGREFSDKIKGVLSIGLHCVKANRGDRPTIDIVLSQLKSMRESYVSLGIDM